MNKSLAIVVVCLNCVLLVSRARTQSTPASGSRKEIIEQRQKSIEASAREEETRIGKVYAGVLHDKGFGMNTGSLLNAVSDPDILVRAAAIHFLGKETDRQTAEALRAELEDPAPAVRLGVASALLQRSDESGFPVVIEILKQPKNPMRAGAVGLLAKSARFNGEKAVVNAQLETLLEDPEPQIRSLAAGGMFETFDPQHPEGLLLKFKAALARERNDQVRTVLKGHIAFLQYLLTLGP